MAPIDRPNHDAALDFIAQNAAVVIVHAEIVQRYAEIGNVPGLKYAVRCMVGHIRACRGGMQAIEVAEADFAARHGGMP